MSTIYNNQNIIPSKESLWGVLLIVNTISPNKLAHNNLSMDYQLRRINMM